MKSPRAAAAALLMSLALYGCGAGDDNSSGGDGGGKRADPSNPVDVLQKIDGCVIPSGTEVGEPDIDGNLYASCDFLDNGGSEGTRFTVRTYGADPREVETADQLQSDDSHKKIIGNDWILTITGDWSAYSAHVDPEAIAEMVGGEYLGP